MTSSDVSHLCPRQAHLDLMHRYAQAIDHCDWTAFAALFTEDAVFIAREGREGEAPRGDVLRWEGRDVLVGAISATIESLAATHHLIGNEMVEVAQDGATARAACHFRAYHAGAGERAHLFEESLGRFVFETVHVGSEWKIRRMDEYIMIMLGTPEAFGTGG